MILKKMNLKAVIVTALVMSALAAAAPPAAGKLRAAELQRVFEALAAGLRAGWTIGHKTGTSGTRGGITVATNDVGILTAPDGTCISIAVLISDSPAPSEARAKLMADLTRATIDHYR